MTSSSSTSSSRHSFALLSLREVEVDFLPSRSAPRWAVGKRRIIFSVTLESSSVSASSFSNDCDPDRRTTACLDSPHLINDEDCLSDDRLDACSSVRVLGVWRSPPVELSSPSGASACLKDIRLADFPLASARQARLAQLRVRVWRERRLGPKQLLGEALVPVWPQLDHAHTPFDNSAASVSRTLSSSHDASAALHQRLSPPMDAADKGRAKTPRFPVALNAPSLLTDSSQLLSVRARAAALAVHDSKSLLDIALTSSSVVARGVPPSSSSAVLDEAALIASFHVDPGILSAASSLVELSSESNHTADANSRGPGLALLREGDCSWVPLLSVNSSSSSMLQVSSLDSAPSIVATAGKCSEVGLHVLWFRSSLSQLEKAVSAESLSQIYAAAESFDCVESGKTILPSVSSTPPNSCVWSSNVAEQLASGIRKSRAWKQLQQQQQQQQRASASGRHAHHSSTCFVCKQRLSCALVWHGRKLRRAQLLCVSCVDEQMQNESRRIYNHARQIPPSSPESDLDSPVKSDSVYADKMYGLSQRLEDLRTGAVVRVALEVNSWRHVVSLANDDDDFPRAISILRRLCAASSRSAAAGLSAQVNGTVGATLPSSFSSLASTLNSGFGRQRDSAETVSALLDDAAAFNDQALATSGEHRTRATRESADSPSSTPQSTRRQRRDRRDRMTPGRIGPVIRKLRAQAHRRIMHDADWDPDSSDEYYLDSEDGDYFVDSYGQYSDSEDIGEEQGPFFEGLGEPSRRNVFAEHRSYPHTISRSVSSSGPSSSSSVSVDQAEPGFEGHEGSGYGSSDAEEERERRGEVFHRGRRFRDDSFRAVHRESAVEDASVSIPFDHSLTASYREDDSNETFNDYPTDSFLQVGGQENAAADRRVSSNRRDSVIVQPRTALESPVSSSVFSQKAVDYVSQPLLLRMLVNRLCQSGPERPDFVALCCRTLLSISHSSDAVQSAAVERGHIITLLTELVKFAMKHLALLQDESLERRQSHRMVSKATQNPSASVSTTSTRSTRTTTSLSDSAKSDSIAVPSLQGISFRTVASVSLFARLVLTLVCESMKGFFKFAGYQKRMVDSGLSAALIFALGSCVIEDNSNSSTSSPSRSARLLAPDQARILDVLLKFDRIFHRRLLNDGLLLAMVDSCLASSSPRPLRVRALALLQSLSDAHQQDIVTRPVLSRIVSALSANRLPVVSVLDAASLGLASGPRQTLAPPSGPHSIPAVWAPVLQCMQLLLRIHPSCYPSLVQLALSKRLALLLDSWLASPAGSSTRFPLNRADREHADANKKAPPRASRRAEARRESPDGVSEQWTDRVALQVAQIIGSMLNTTNDALLEDMIRSGLPARLLLLLTRSRDERMFAAALAALMSLSEQPWGSMAQKSLTQCGYTLALAHLLGEPSASAWRRSLLLRALQRAGPRAALSVRHTLPFLVGLLASCSTARLWFESVRDPRLSRDEQSPSLDALLLDAEGVRRATDADKIPDHQSLSGRRVDAKKELFTGRCVQAFQAQLDGDLSLEIGDLVTVLAIGSRWWLGFKQGSSSSNHEGGAANVGDRASQAFVVPPVSRRLVQGPIQPWFDQMYRPCGYFPFNVLEIDSSDANEVLLHALRTQGPVNSLSPPFNTTALPDVAAARVKFFDEQKNHARFGSLNEPSSGKDVSDFLESCDSIQPSACPEKEESNTGSSAPGSAHQLLWRSAVAVSDSVHSPFHPSSWRGPRPPQPIPARERLRLLRWLFNTFSHESLCNAGILAALFSLVRECSEASSGKKAPFAIVSEVVAGADGVSYRDQEARSLDGGGAPFAAEPVPAVGDHVPSAKKVYRSTQHRNAASSSEETLSGLSLLLRTRLEASSVFSSLLEWVVKRFLREMSESDQSSSIQSGHRGGKEKQRAKVPEHHRASTLQIELSRESCECLLADMTFRIVWSVRHDIHSVALPFARIACQMVPYDMLLSARLPDALVWQLFAGGLARRALGRSARDILSLLDGFDADSLQHVPWLMMARLSGPSVYGLLPKDVIRSSKETDNVRLRKEGEEMSKDDSFLENHSHRAEREAIVQVDFERALHRRALLRMRQAGLSLDIVGRFDDEQVEQVDDILEQINLQRPTSSDIYAAPLYHLGLCSRVGLYGAFSTADKPQNAFQCGHCENVVVCASCAEDCHASHAGLRPLYAPESVVDDDAASNKTRAPAGTRTHGSRRGRLGDVSPYASIAVAWAAEEARQTSDNGHSEAKSKRQEERTDGENVEIPWQLIRRAQSSVATGARPLPPLPNEASVPLAASFTGHLRSINTEHRSTNGSSHKRKKRRAKSPIQSLSNGTSTDKQSNLVVDVGADSMLVFSCQCCQSSCRRIMTQTDTGPPSNEEKPVRKEEQATPGDCLPAIVIDWIHSFCKSSKDIGHLSASSASLSVSTLVKSGLGLASTRLLTHSRRRFWPMPIDALVSILHSLQDIAVDQLAESGILGELIASLPHGRTPLSPVLRILDQMSSEQLDSRLSLIDRIIGMIPSLLLHPQVISLFEWMRSRFGADLLCERRLPLALAAACQKHAHQIGDNLEVVGEALMSNTVEVSYPNDGGGSQFDRLALLREAETVSVVAGSLSEHLGSGISADFAPKTSASCAWRAFQSLLRVVPGGASGADLVAGQCLAPLSVDSTIGSKAVAIDGALLFVMRSGALPLSDASPGASATLLRETLQRARQCALQSGTVPPGVSVEECWSALERSGLISSLIRRMGPRSPLDPRIVRLCSACPLRESFWASFSVSSDSGQSSDDCAPDEPSETSCTAESGPLSRLLVEYGLLNELLLSMLRPDAFMDSSDGSPTLSPSSALQWSFSARSRLCRMWHIDTLFPRQIVSFLARYTLNRGIGVTRSQRTRSSMRRFLNEGEVCQEDLFEQSDTEDDSFVAAPAARGKEKDINPSVSIDSQVRQGSKVRGPSASVDIGGQGWVGVGTVPRGDPVATENRVYGAVDDFSAASETPSSAPAWLRVGLLLQRHLFGCLETLEIRRIAPNTTPQQDPSSASAGATAEAVDATIDFESRTYSSICSIDAGSAYLSAVSIQWNSGSSSALSSLDNAKKSLAIFGAPSLSCAQDIERAFSGVSAEHLAIAMEERRVPAAAVAQLHSLRQPTKSDGKERYFPASTGSLKSDNFAPSSSSSCSTSSAASGEEQVELLEWLRLAFDDPSLVPTSSSLGIQAQALSSSNASLLTCGRSSSPFSVPISAPVGLHRQSSSSRHSEAGQTVSEQTVFSEEAHVSVSRKTSSKKQDRRHWQSLNLCRIFVRRSRFSGACRLAALAVGFDDQQQAGTIHFSIPLAPTHRTFSYSVDANTQRLLCMKVARAQQKPLELKFEFSAAPLASSLKDALDSAVREWPRVAAWFQAKYSDQIVRAAMRPVASNSPTVSHDTVTSFKGSRRRPSLSESKKKIQSVSAGNRERALALRRKVRRRSRPAVNNSASVFSFSVHLISRDESSVSNRDQLAAEARRRHRLLCSSTHLRPDNTSSSGDAIPDSTSDLSNASKDRALIGDWMLPLAVVHSTTGDGVNEMYREVPTRRERLLSHPISVSDTDNDCSSSSVSPVSHIVILQIDRGARTCSPVTARLRFLGSVSPLPASVTLASTPSSQSSPAPLSTGLALDSSCRLSSSLALRPSNTARPSAATNAPTVSLSVFAYFDPSLRDARDCEQLAQLRRWQRDQEQSVASQALEVAAALDERRQRRQQRRAQRRFYNHGFSVSKSHDDNQPWMKGPDAPSISSPSSRLFFAEGGGGQARQHWLRNRYQETISPLSASSPMNESYPASPTATCPSCPMVNGRHRWFCPRSGSRLHATQNAVCSVCSKPGDRFHCSRSMWQQPMMFSTTDTGLPVVGAPPDFASSSTSTIQHIIPPPPPLSPPPNANQNLTTNALLPPPLTNSRFEAAMTGPEPENDPAEQHRVPTSYSTARFPRTEEKIEQEPLPYMLEMPLTRSGMLSLLEIALGREELALIRDSWENDRSCRAIVEGSFSHGDFNNEDGDSNSSDSSNASSYAGAPLGAFVAAEDLSSSDDLVIAIPPEARAAIRARKRRIEIDKDNNVDEEEENDEDANSSTARLRQRVRHLLESMTSYVGLADDAEHGLSNAENRMDDSLASHFVEALALLHRLSRDSGISEESINVDSGNVDAGNVNAGNSSLPSSLADDTTSRWFEDNGQETEAAAQQPQVTEQDEELMQIFGLRDD